MFLGGYALLQLYELPLVRRWRSEKSAPQAGLRVCVQNVPQGRAGEHGEIGEEDGLPSSFPLFRPLGQHHKGHTGASGAALAAVGQAWPLLCAMSPAVE